MAKYRKNTKSILLEKYGSRCAYCGFKITTETLTVDHIQPRNRNLPLSLRGSNDIENCNPSCATCNSSKSNMTLDQWRIELSNKIERARKDSSAFCMAERFGLVKPTKKPVVFYFERQVSNG